MSDPWTTETPRAKAERLERAKHGGYTLVELDRIAMTPYLWATLHGRVSDRVTQQPVDYHPSPLQRRMFERYTHCQKRQVPCRMVVVKIRRGGGSTGANALMYLHAHNYTARIGGVGTDEKVSMNMFEMLRFFQKHDRFPTWPPLVKELETGYLEWTNGSTWEKFTAENPEAARSAGLSGYHATEVGRWQDGGAKDAKETLRSMLGAVPRRGFTVCIEESTAQGASGAFYDRFTSGRWPAADELGCEEGKEYWQQWAEETPQNLPVAAAERAMQFVRVFAAWFEDDENRPEAGISSLDVENLKRTLDEAEMKLIARYRTIGPQGERLGKHAKKATLWEQLAWRRATIAIEFEGDVDAFAQENPSSPAEAFQSSGRHTFNRAGCAYMVHMARGAHPTYGVLTRQKDGAVTFSPREKRESWMCFWEEPREGYHYNGSLDTCSGKAFQKTSDDADYNAGVILRRSHLNDDRRKMPHKVVAGLLEKDQLEADVLAEKMNLLADWYGHCQLTVERNNTGLAVIHFLRILGANLYTEVTTDRSTSEDTGILGLMTTSKTRPLIIAELKKRIRNNANSDTRGDGVDVPALWICEQCQDMIVHPDGKDAAPGRRHDDGCIALGLGLYTMDGATYFAAHVRKRRPPPDLGDWKSWKA